jgi:hypothetical protein
LREEHRPRVFEIGVLRNVFGPKKEEVKGGCGKLHNVELYDLCSLINIVRVIQPAIMRWTGHVARGGGQEQCRQGFGGEAGQMEGLVVDGEKIIQWICKK